MQLTRNRIHSVLGGFLHSWNRQPILGEGPQRIGQRVEILRWEQPPAKNPSDWADLRTTCVSYCARKPENVLAFTWKELDAASSVKHSSKTDEFSWNLRHPAVPMQSSCLCHASLRNRKIVFSSNSSATWGLYGGWTSNPLILPVQNSCENQWKKVTFSWEFLKQTVGFACFFSMFAACQRQSMSDSLLAENDRPCGCQVLCYYILSTYMSEPCDIIGWSQSYQTVVGCHCCKLTHQLSPWVCNGSSLAESDWAYLHHPYYIHPTTPT